ncbi:MAG: hypothetical protein ACRD10_10350, partial [Terriglobia bacterium]
DQLSLATETLDNRLRIYPPGAAVPFTVERKGERLTITVKLDPPVADDYRIEEVASASPEQIHIRQEWLQAGPVSGQSGAGN